LSAACWSAVCEEAWTSASSVAGTLGGTNALRTQGKSFALWVLLIDIVKGWIAARLIAQLVLPGVDPSPPDLSVWAPAACGIAAIAGHVYPLWHGFRGGKGVATLVGVVVGIEPSLLLPMLLTWFVGRGDLSDMWGLLPCWRLASIPLYVSGFEPSLPVTVFGVVATRDDRVYPPEQHRPDCGAHTEPRAKRLWFVRAPSMTDDPGDDE